MVTPNLAIKVQQGLMAIKNYYSLVVPMRVYYRVLIYVPSPKKYQSGFLVC